MIIHRLAAGGAAALSFFFFFFSPVRRGSIRVKRGRRSELRPGKLRPVCWQPPPPPPPPSAFSVILPASEKESLEGCLGEERQSSRVAVTEVLRAVPRVRASFRDAG